MNFSDALSYISSREGFAVKVGLQRIDHMLQFCGNPQNRAGIFHIAGTNGKGSVSAFIYNILLRAGCKSGLYISPYVTYFRERIQIAGEDITESEFTTAFEHIKPAADELELAGDPPTQFEIITAAAFKAFELAGCDAVALETGMGGRLDATNAVTSPAVCALTDISLDHMGVLGNTVEQIAGEKCGIIKPGRPVVSSPTQSRAALGVIRETCRQRGSLLIVPDLNTVNITKETIHGTEFEYKNMSLAISLAGRHQISNALTAIEAVMAWDNGKIQPEDIVQGINATKFPARFEVVDKDKPLIVDGAHNPAAMAALSGTVEKLLGGGITAIIGMAEEKNYADAIEKFAPVCERIITVTPKNTRTPALDAGILAAECRKHCDNVIIAEDIQDALSIAYEFPNPILVCGSLALVGEVKRTVS